MKKALLLTLVAIFFSSVAYSQTTSEKLKAIEEEIKLVEAQAKLDSLKQIQNRTTIDIPCADELDVDPNYITGLGIGEPKINPRSKAEARKLAISKAKLEISSKWMGTIDNVVEEYYKRSSDNNGDKEGLEETLRVSGEKAINQFMRELCSNIIEEREEKRTSITCYYAAKVPISEVVTAIVKDCEKKGYTVNQEKMQESIVIVLNPQISK